MSNSAENPGLKELVRRGVAEALEQEKSKLVEAVLEAIEDAALIDAMEEADDELADPAVVERILAGKRGEG